ncbi:hypothetical protein T492DRAFT_1001712 [Pavlovales sp. CCMP2436]|nr:hypothetical protein T492DRAFT_1001712 [Pavlovales sp. CCMP2436]
MSLGGEYNRSSNLTVKVIQSQFYKTYICAGRVSCRIPRLVSAIQLRTVNCPAFITRKCLYF